jgi:D-alanyl-D-alanine carboxypeptidase (penicillin-binding protein 5/6)
MNEKAREFRLRDTRFVNPDGLDAPGEHSSAADVTRLARIAMRRPAIRDVVRRRTDTIGGGRVLHTWNDLLGSFPGLIGVKTGHTGAAGWCEVGAARGPGLTIYATVLGDPSRSVRNDDLAALLRWGLSRYRTLPVIAGHTAYAQAAVGYGRAPLELVASHQLRRSVRIDHRLVQRVIAPTTATLPVRRGERFGEIRVYEGPRLLGSRPLVASRSISRPGLVGRVGWYAGRAVHHVLHLFR